MNEGLMVLVDDEVPQLDRTAFIAGNCRRNSVDTLGSLMSGAPEVKLRYVELGQGPACKSRSKSMI